MLQTVKYRPLIKACADLVGLPAWEEYEPAEWLEGLILTESGGNPQAIRYEPHQDRPGRSDAYSDADSPGVDDGFLEDDKSYGLMQIMGYNIRRLCGIPPGTKINFKWALLPVANLSLGLRVLHGELKAVGGDVERALCRYNGGPTGDDVREGKDGQPEYRRAEYVRKVRMNSDRVARSK